MANDVFANGLEVACKAADGVSSAAFPDVCWTPKEPVPFANTAKAKDLSNGSVTVFISGKPVAQKDKSYFKTSSGDDSARGRKGMTTGAKNGKAYFRSWSMNVKVEGYNVCRHTDSMTHNHGSYPGNTNFWKYTDTKWYEKFDCKDEKKKMNKACGKNKNTENLNWKAKNCKFLNFKPSAEGLMNFKGLESPTELLSELKDHLGDVNILESAISTARDAAIDLAIEKGVKLGLKVVASKLVPVVGWIYSAATAADDIAQADYYLKMYDGAKAESARILSNVENIKNDISDLISELDKEVPNLEKVGEKLADWQRNAATANECIRARKCMLVPYNDTKGQSGITNVTKKSKGCCPGQTGHHLIPHAFAKDAGCKNYKEGTAPTVCAEGESHSTGGSHAAMHTATTEMLLVKDGVLGKAKKMKYADVRDGVLDAHAKTFPFSTCSRGCLKEQLDNYYKKCDKFGFKVTKIGSDPTATVVDISID